MLLPRRPAEGPKFDSMGMKAVCFVPRRFQTSEEPLTPKQTNRQRLARAAAASAHMLCKSARFLLLALFAVHLGALLARADIMYNINQTITSAYPTGNPFQTDTITGIITTDGTIGVIQSTDVVSWNLSLTDTLNSAYDVTLTPANSSLVEDTGSALSATPTGLFFNYSGSGEFLIQANSPGAYSGYSYFCFSTGVYACAAGETISPNYIYTDGVVATGAAAPIGNQPLGPTSAVPEPSSVVLMATILAAATLSGRKRINATN